MEKRYKVKINSSDKLEELLQEIYNQACNQLNQVQYEMDKLGNSTNLGADDISIEDKTKYSKAMHDYLGDKERAIKSKFEIAKLMSEIIKYSGDVNNALNDPSFAKATKLDIKSLKNAALSIDDNDNTDTETYVLKK